MKFHLLAGALTSALFVHSAFAAGPVETDAQFVEKASVGNTFEVEESKLAQTQATDPKLKSFADRMIKDHQDAMNKLQQAAVKTGHAAKMKLDAPHQAMLDNIKKYNGSDFDKIYMADQIAAHVETQALLLDYKQNGKTGALTTWTNEALPVVQQHLAAIQSM